MNAYWYEGADFSVQEKLGYNSSVWYSLVLANSISRIPIERSRYYATLSLHTSAAKINWKFSRTMSGPKVALAHAAKKGPSVVTEIVAGISIGFFG